MSSEPIALKVTNKIDRELNFLYKKNKFLTPELCGMYFNAFIQLHFDYACPTRYPNFNKETKWNIQITPKNLCNFVLH